MWLLWFVFLVRAQVGPFDNNARHVLPSWVLLDHLHDVGKALLPLLLRLLGEVAIQDLACPTVNERAPMSHISNPTVLGAVPDAMAPPVFDSRVP
jgi:hypothetical protein